MEVRLKRDGWHRKLQKFVFRYPPDFYNFCPYFWVTIFCILITFIIPVVPLIKGIKYLFLGIAWLFEKCLDGFNDYICEPIFEWLARNMPDDEILRSHVLSLSSEQKFWDDEFHKWESEKQKDFLFWRDDYMGGTIFMESKRKRKLKEKFDIWKKNTSDWEKKIEEMKVKQRQYWLDRVARKEKEWKEEQEKERKAQQERLNNVDKIRVKEQKKREMFTAIVKYTKYVAYALGLSILAFAGYWMYRFINWVYQVVNWPAFWSGTLEVLKWGGIGLICLAVLVGFIYGIIIICKKCTISIGDIPGMRSTGRGIATFSIWNWKLWLFPALIQVGKFLDWLAGGVEFLWIYFKTIKENNCPEIIWEEEKQKQN